jgi:hypothetical protein
MRSILIVERTYNQRGINKGVVVAKGLFTQLIRALLTILMCICIIIEVEREECQAYNHIATFEDAHLFCSRGEKVVFKP